MKVQYVCIEKLDINHLRTETLVVFNEGLIENNVFYKLKGTPCEQVLGKNFLCYQSGVAKLFPTAITLLELKAESFAGSTLFDSEGVPIGLITVIGQKEMSNLDDVKLIFDLIIPRLASEMERRRSAESIQLVSDTQTFLLTCGMWNTDEDYFQSMAKYLAKKLKMQYVCIDKLDLNNLIAETLVVFNEGRIENNIFYELKGTPCEQVLGKNFCCYQSGVAKLFPTDIALPELKAESYAGSTLFDSEGLPIGLIMVIGQKEMSNLGDVKLIFDLIIPRLSSELERIRSAESIQKAYLEVSDTLQKEQAIINSLTANISVLDETGVIIQVNESWSRFADQNQFINSNHFMGTNYIKIAEAATGDEHETGRLIANAIKNIIAGKENEFSLEYPCHSPSEQRWFIVSITPLKTEGVNGVVVAHENITERKLAELALLKNDQLIIKLTNQVPGAVYQYKLNADGTSCFLFASDGMKLIYELNPEELHQDATPVFERIHPDDYDAFVNSIKESAITLEGYHQEFRVILPVRGLRWILSNSKPEKLDDGATVWYGIMTDITERKLAENAIKESEYFFRESQKAASIGSFKINRLTNEWESSEVLDNIFGIDENYTRHTKGLLNLIHPDDAFMIENYIAEVILKKKNLIHLECRIRCKADGNTKWILAIADTKFSLQNDLITIIGTVQDITDRKNAEITLSHKMHEIERFNNIMIGRELKMIELKKEVNELLRKSEENEKYTIVE